MPPRPRTCWLPRPGAGAPAVLTTWLVVAGLVCGALPGLPTAAADSSGSSDSSGLASTTRQLSTGYSPAADYDPLSNQVVLMLKAAATGEDCTSPRECSGTEAAGTSQAANAGTGRLRAERQPVSGDLDRSVESPGTTISLSVAQDPPDADPDPDQGASGSTSSPAEEDASGEGSGSGEGGADEGAEPDPEAGDEPGADDSGESDAEDADGAAGDPDGPDGTAGAGAPAGGLSASGEGVGYQRSTRVRPNGTGSVSHTLSYKAQVPPPGQDEKDPWTALATTPPPEGERICVGVVTLTYDTGGDLDTLVLTHAAEGAAAEGVKDVEPGTVVTTVVTTTLEVSPLNDADRKVITSYARYALLASGGVTVPLTALYPSGEPEDGISDIVAVHATTSQQVLEGAAVSDNGGADAVSPAWSADQLARDHKQLTSRDL